MVAYRATIIKTIHAYSGGAIIKAGDSLVKQLKAGLTHTHFLLYTKLRNGGVLRRTLATKNLATGSTMVLEKQKKHKSRSTSAYAL